MLTKLLLPPQWIPTFSKNNPFGDGWNIPENWLKTDRTNILFDTNNNKIFTITDFARDILDNCSGRQIYPIQ
jgi:hypothetical protein